MPRLGKRRVGVGPHGSSRAAECPERPFPGAGCSVAPTVPAAVGDSVDSVFPSTRSGPQCIRLLMPHAPAPVPRTPP